MPVQKVYRKNDRPEIEVTVKDGENTVVDLTSATSPLFIMRQVGQSSAKVNQTATVEAPATAGVMTYQFGSGDLDTLGFFEAHFRVTIGSEILSIPTAENIEIEVIDELT